MERTTLGCSKQIAARFNRLRRDLTQNAFFKRLLTLWETLPRERRDYWLRIADSERKPDDQPTGDPPRLRDR